MLRGAVQGVGFRPFVHRLATTLGLCGWVHNSLQGLTAEVEGPAPAVQQFLLRLAPECPPAARIHSCESVLLAPAGYTGFEIRPSDTAGEPLALILPDLATCAECRRELLDPANRRYRYPFINCTHCGPRFSIIEDMPYDRPRTTMRHFRMCPACQAEYENPADRRFHAQPNACPVCGPELALWSPAGAVLAEKEAALQQAEAALRAGQILALKGLGGFHLLVDARNPEAVARLRQRKHREEKPLALMFPALAQVEQLCEVHPLEARLLQSAEAPIVLLRRRARGEVAENVAPGNPWLGIMLPYTPLHHLLLADLQFPLVATSGNLSDEPICTDEHEALRRLAGLADLFLVHNRPIARHVDDSIVRVMLGRELVLRRARGYAPLPMTLRTPLPPLLAFGAHLKTTVAVAAGRHVFLSQHLGDLETAEARAAYQRAVADLPRLLRQPPQLAVCDLHPDYVSTQLARQSGLPCRAVQHHVAHVAACVAENEVEAPVLGVSWDGTGYGPDQTIWGGEFIHLHAGRWRRVGHLRPFPLPGGEAAVREPRRAALGVLFALWGDAVFERAADPLRAAFQPAEWPVLRAMLARGLNCPRTTSAGRLFDAVAALIGLRQRAHFEGQAAMELEWAAAPWTGQAAYPLALHEEDGLLLADWGPMVEAILQAVRAGLPTAQIAGTFHQSLVNLIVAVAQRAGLEHVALTGGCFQNQRLTEGAVQALRAAGFRPLWHQRVPPNDGGLALGQAVLGAQTENQ
ncbi:MAG: carbamoyltransferase HypF [Verrucomicrobiae bacterium]|nr:carbamoyltransferase HypF [Verrucomicrobiae bacterium]